MNSAKSEETSLVQEIVSYTNFEIARDDIHGHSFISYVLKTRSLEELYVRMLRTRYLVPSEET